MMTDEHLKNVKQISIAESVEGLGRNLVCQTFKELCGSFQACLALGPCVLLLDGVDELGASLGLSPQEVSILCCYF